MGKNTDHQVGLRVTDEASVVQDANKPVRDLISLAVTGLEHMFDPQSRLFCTRMTRSKEGLVREGTSERYTIMSLLGLHRLEATGGWSPIEIKAVLQSLIKNCLSIDDIGDVGLLIWLTSLALPERLDEICSDLRIESALNRFPAARQGRTMELAWFLSGLAHAAMVQPRRRLDLTDLAHKTYQLLKQNQGSHGSFGHQTRGGVAGALRGRIGSFADQVYPIYGLARFAQAFAVQPALEVASRCAEAICRVQGGLGQWWWHYDATSGRVLQKYPVYAVHQDGMAPMALFALSEAKGTDYSGPIYKGLAWITGCNELHSDLRDSTSGVIWRNIHRVGWSKYPRELASFLRSRETHGSTDQLDVLFECRPYHLGWLLYAFAGRVGD